MHNSNKSDELLHNATTHNATTQYNGKLLIMNQILISADDWSDLLKKKTRENLSQQQSMTAQI